MSWVVFWAVLGVLILVFTGAVIYFVVDWRGLAVKWVGDNPDYGMAYVKVGGKWRYRESEISHKYRGQWTYTRTEGTKKKPVFITDRVPISVINRGEFDEYTGRLLYRIRDGSSIAEPFSTDDGDVINYPSRLISADLLAEVAVYLNESVKGLKKAFDWRPLAIIGIIILLVLGILAGTGVIHGPRAVYVPAPAAATSNATANMTPTAPGSVTATPVEGGP